MVVDERQRIIARLAKAIEDRGTLDPTEPNPDSVAAAGRALEQVELYLGVRLDEGKDMIEKVLHDRTA